MGRETAAKGKDGVGCGGATRTYAHAPYAQKGRSAQGFQPTNHRSKPRTLIRVQVNDGRGAGVNTSHTNCNIAKHISPSATAADRQDNTTQEKPVHSRPRRCSVGVWGRVCVCGRGQLRE
jgi:hypothetical protein